jgi:Ca2+-binding EF-hand superfamily protein
MKSSIRWKASLLNKRERESKPVLTEEDIDFRTTNTNYSEEEITEWFREFILDCPDNNGSLDFCEFILATHCTANSSPEDKLHWVFQMQDKDSSGSITIGKMIQVFEILYENEGLAQEIAVQRAEKIVGSLDSNNDGHITEAEIVAGCMEDEEMLKMLSDSSADPPLLRESSSGSLYLLQKH